MVSVDFLVVLIPDGLITFCATDLSIDRVERESTCIGDEVVLSDEGAVDTQLKSLA